VRYVWILFLFIAMPCWSQAAQTGNAETSGFCSPAVTGSNNQFTITCQNIPDKLRVQLVDLLNRVARNQADAEAILGKLDGCLEGVKEVRERQAPWGLTDDQKKELKRRLIGSKAKVSIHVIPQDRNASLFGMDLLSVLRESGWDIGEGLNSDFTLSAALVGVTIAVDHTDFPEAIVLQTALHSVGIETTGVIDSEKRRVKESAQIFVAIGAKPLPSQSPSTH
jgi:hypothetical protein